MNAGTGGALGGLTPEQVAVVDLEGEQVDDELRPTSELELHSAVYRRCGAGAVAHTHPPYADNFSLATALRAECRFARLWHGQRPTGLVASVRVSR